jgi:hypothetical protein
MTLNREQLEEFFERLEGPEGCDFRVKDPNVASSVTWKCKGGTDKTFATKILKSMMIDDAEIADFLERCEATGGYCDCEILFNSQETLLK